LWGIREGFHTQWKGRECLKQLRAHIGKGKPYQWNVMSANDNGKYVPYPAYNIQLAFDSLNDLLTIHWEASDVDGDSLSYDLVLFENDIEVLNETDLTVNTKSNIPVAVGAHFFATIIVEDEIGATSKTSSTVVYQ